MTTTFQHGYALLVGVGQSEYAPYSLTAATLDAKALHGILRDPARCAYPESHIRLLHDSGATRGAILDGMEWLAEQAAGDPEATVIIFFSGHGWLSADGSAYCLLPHDVIPTDIPGSALTGKDFSAALQAIRARRLLVILDCCHAGGMASPKDAELARRMPAGLRPGAPPDPLLSELRRGSGRAIFSSSLGSQKSWIRPDGKSSLYTYCLIQALQGAGNKAGDTVVSLSNLMNHLKNTVPESARQLHQEQTPFFGMESEDFPVAMLMGGRGLEAASATPAPSAPPQQPISQTITNHGDFRGFQGVNTGHVTQHFK